MEERQPARRGSSPSVPPRPIANRSTVRSVIGVGPGARTVTRFSPIVAVRPPGVGTGQAGAGRRAVGPGLPEREGQPPASAASPAAGVRPMHPPIARVNRPSWVAAAAVQAGAAAARAAVGQPAPPTSRPGTVPRSGGIARIGFGMPSLRRNVCPHFYMTGARGAIPIQAPHLLKALIRQETNVSRCQVRGGVHLEQGFVNDVCLSARFNQCIFYEDELGR